MMNRRALIGGAVAGCVALAAGRWQARAAEAGKGWFASKHLPIGLQLYTIGQLARQDLDGTLARVAQIGYRTVELAGYHGHTVDELHAAADKHHLKFTSIHVSAIANGTDPGLDQDIPKLAADLHKLGVTDVVMPMFQTPEHIGGPKPGEGPGYMTRVATSFTREDWLHLAELLNDRGGKLRAEGLRFGYHNHNVEFAPIGDTNGLELLIDNTSREDVVFEMDVGWVAASGTDPLPLLKKHSGRFQLMHVKDIGPNTKPNFALQQQPFEVGSGTLEWAAILPAAFDAGVRKFYVEQEPPFTMDRFAAIGKSFDFLNTFEVSTRL